MTTISNFDYALITTGAGVEKALNAKDKISEIAINNGGELLTIIPCEYSTEKNRGFNKFGKFEFGNYNLAFRCKELKSILCIITELAKIDEEISPTKIIAISIYKQQIGDRMNNIAFITMDSAV